MAKIYRCTHEETINDIGLNDVFTNIYQGFTTWLIDDTTYANQIAQVKDGLYKRWGYKFITNPLAKGLAEYGTIKNIINTYINLQMANKDLLVYCNDKPECNNTERQNLVRLVAKQSGTTNELVYDTLLVLDELIRKGEIKDNRLLNPRLWAETVGTKEPPDMFRGEGLLGQIMYYGKWVLVIGAVGLTVYGVSQFNKTAGLLKGK